MRDRRLAALALAAAILCGIGPKETGAFTTSIVRPLAESYAKPGYMPPYGAALHEEVLSEIRLSQAPFSLTMPTALVVRFTVDRQGKLVSFELIKSSGSKSVDEFAELMVRRASRNFPAPLASLPGDQQAFMIPISFSGEMRRTDD